jgi:hypothetical protein
MTYSRQSLRQLGVVEVSAAMGVLPYAERLSLEHFGVTAGLRLALVVTVGWPCTSCCSCGTTPSSSPRPGV